MKFSEIHPRQGTDPSAYEFTPADKLVSFAQQHGMLVRGHCLVWYQQVSSWVRAVMRTQGPDSLSSILKNHISMVVRRYAGKVWAWDVVNEAFMADGSMRRTIWADTGRIAAGTKRTAYIEQALRWAHKADPKAKLFYNDYAAERTNKKSNAIYAMARDFRNRGVPLDGIGFQAHLRPSFDKPHSLKSFAANLERFSDLGLELHITELDVALEGSDPSKLAAQAHVYEKVNAVCLQTANCRVIQSWGFTDKYSWIPWHFKGKYGWGLPYDAQYHPKPAYDSMLRTLQAK